MNFHREVVGQLVNHRRRFMEDGSLNIPLLIAAPEGPTDQIFPPAGGKIPQAKNAAHRNF